MDLVIVLVSVDYNNPVCTHATKLQMPRQYKLVVMQIKNVTWNRAEVRTDMEGNLEQEGER